ncbi:MAG: hypothetical protein AB1714_27400 [Acidobacteriota bacterium]
MNSRIRLLATVAMVVFAWPLVTVSAEPPNEATGQTTDKKVLAFYFPWYRAKPVDGRWSKWNGNDPHRHYPPEDIASPYYPLLGPYTSTPATTYRAVDSDGRVKWRTSIKWHMKWMADANIDVVVVSWWGRKDRGAPETPERLPDELMPEIMQEAMAKGLKVAILRDQDSVASGTLEDQFYYILQKYAYNPAVTYDSCYWRIGGRPVLMHFGNTGAGEDATFAGVFNQVRNNRTKYGGGAPPLIISNGTPEFKGFLKDNSVDVARKIVKRAADGLFLWARGYDETWAYKEWIAKVISHAPAIAIPTVMPGFDPSEFSDNPRRVERSADHYRTAWTDTHLAWDGNPSAGAYISVTTFNDFTEADQIEPVEDYGRYRTYNTPNDPFLYITITQQEAADFKR